MMAEGNGPVKGEFGGRQPMHPLAFKALQFFKGKAVGFQVTADELEAELRVGCGPSSEGKQRIRTALKKLYNDHQIYGKWDRLGQVLTLLPATETVDESTRKLRSVARAAKKVQRITLCLDESSLTAEKRKEWVACQVQALTIEKLASAKATKALMDSSDRIVAPDVPKLLKLMKE